MFYHPVPYNYYSNNPAAIHPTITEPVEWFNYLPQNYSGFSFDFFINWSNRPPTLSNEIWIKLIVNTNIFNQTYIDNPWPTTDLNAIAQQIVATETVQKLNMIGNFTIAHNLKAVYKIFDDNTNWAQQPNQILSVEIENNNFSNFRYQQLRDVQTEIRNLSGGPVKIGSKGLMVATSMLERHLSLTDSLWPGDCDFLLLENGLPKAVIEFKKNTKDPSSKYHRPIANECLENYYSTTIFKPDNRKYNRLAILKDSIAEDIPIIIVYYPTWIDNNPARNVIKVEKVTGGLNSLSVSNSYITPVPANTVDSKSQFIQQLINFI